MVIKRTPPSVSVPLTRKQKDTIQSITKENGISTCILMRRLLAYVLNKKIEVPVLFQKSKVFRVMEEPKSSGSVKTPSVRTPMDTVFYSQVVSLADEWGSTPSIIMRALLLLFLDGQISMQDIW